jgi:hypothetical protein
MTSSHPRKPFLPVRLLRIVSSFLDFVWSRLASLPTVLRQAWSHFKFDRVEHEPHRPNADPENQESGQNHKRTPPVIGPSVGKLPASSSEGERIERHYPGPYTGQVPRFFIAPVRILFWPFKKLLDFLNHNAGAFSLLATVAIAVLTYRYSVYSKKQWETMDRQLKDAQAMQRAQLVIQFDDPVVYEKDGDLYIRGTIQIVNVGQTSAIQFAITHGTAGGIKRPENCAPYPGLIKPDPGGATIPGGGKFPYLYDFWLGPAAKIDKSEYFGSYDLVFAYRDLFGGSGYVHQWYVYSRYLHRLLPC